MLQSLKLTVYQAAKRTGYFAAVANSNWRRNRLVILCYHGVALDDEHRWNPKLYVTAALLRRRLETLRKSGCNVLPLGEALERLHAGGLPARSVVLTFDDGFYDFHRQAAPLLREYQLPATVYVTSYYALSRRLGLRSDAQLTSDGRGSANLARLARSPGNPLPLTSNNQFQTWRRITQFVSQAEFSGLEKDVCSASSPAAWTSIIKTLPPGAFSSS